MIDAFSLALSHALVLLAAWRLLPHPDLDRDEAEPAKTSWPGSDRTDA